MRTVFELQQLLEAGKVLLLLCDTVYGLLAKAPDGFAVLQQLKGRSEDKPFLQLYGSVEQLQQSPWLLPVPKLLCYWPGPLTCVLGPKCEAGAGAQPQQGSQAVRIPRHALLQALCLKVGPLYSTSANRSGAAVASCPEHLQRIFAKEIAEQLLVPHFPECEFKAQGVPKELRASTLVDARVWPPEVLRQGSLNLIL